MNNIMLKIILPIFGIVAILGFITWFIPVKQQDAAWLEGTQHYACGPWLTVELIPNSETCNGSNNGNISSYQSSILVKAAPGSTGAYAVHWKWNSYWCPTEDPHAPCMNLVASTGEQVGGLTGDNQAYVTANSKVSSPTGQYAGLTCGYYQNDFAFYVTNNNNPSQVVCGISLANPGVTNNNASWCHTGVSCAVPTPTSVPTPTNAPTPTSVPTPTNAPTPTAVPSATPTPTSAPTATPVPPTPTGTSTNTNNCGDTTQVGVNGSNNNNNCNQNNNQNNNNNNNSQSQSQTQNNNQSVNITLNSQQPQQQQQQQQQVLAASTGPKELPETGAASDVIFGLLALIPVGWKIRKLV